MKKFIPILVVVLCLVSVSAFANGPDYKLGVNVKGNDPALALEFGRDGDYFGSYAQVGLNKISGLGGLTLSTPGNPVFLFGGVGAQLGSKDVGIDITEVTATGVCNENFCAGFINYYEETSSFSVDTVSFFGEAGVGFDLGAVYTKIGWTNFNGLNDFSVSLGISL